MYRLMRFYNQNRKKIWKTLGIIAFLFIVLQIFNYAAANKSVEYNTTKSDVSTIVNEYNEVTLENENSAISGSSITTSQADSLSVINNFIDYCNNGKVQEAYDLLTDECKDEMYSTVSTFKDTYYATIFGNGKKNVTIENYIGNIYTVNFKEDFLSTGNYSTSDTIQDYITIKDNKLNINKYVGREEFSKEQESNNIKISVVRRDTYMDYETYTITVSNNSDKAILLDDLVDINSMYITDSKGVTYSSYTHELSTVNLVVNSKGTRNFKIKYYSNYQSNKKITSMKFSRIVLDYNTYKNTVTKSNYNNYGGVEVKF